MESTYIALETEFRNVTCVINETCVTFKFSRSTLLDNYRANNHLLTRDARHRNSYLSFVLTTLLNNAPPDAESLMIENSGGGRVTVFLSQTWAEFNELCRSPGDRLCLDGPETNLLRVVCDFFWANFVCTSYCYSEK